MAITLTVETNPSAELGAESNRSVEMSAESTIKVTGKNYEELLNKPSIGGTELIGDKSLDDIGAYSQAEVDVLLSGKANTSDIPTVPTNVSAFTNDADYITHAALPTKVSDLTNDVGYITGMTILSYGSSTWNDFITAYTAKKVVYCRASSNSNPASGSQTRLAFMAYVNNAESPTEVEFQYYRSVSSHNATQQGDQVYVYKLTKTGGWSVTVRECYTRIVAGAGINATYSNGILTISLDE